MAPPSAHETQDRRYRHKKAAAKQMLDRNSPLTDQRNNVEDLVMEMVSPYHENLLQLRNGVGLGSVLSTLLELYENIKTEDRSDPFAFEGRPVPTVKHSIEVNSGKSFSSVIHICCPI
jgi:hypothetical protein